MAEGSCRKSNAVEETEGGLRKVFEKLSRGTASGTDGKETSLQKNELFPDVDHIDVQPRAEGLKARGEPVMRYQSNMLFAVVLREFLLGGSSTY